MLTFDHRDLLTPFQRSGRIQDAGVPVHQPIEEASQRRQVQIPLGSRAAQADELLVDHARRIAGNSAPSSLRQARKRFTATFAGFPACAGCGVRRRGIHPRRSGPPPARATSSGELLSLCLPER